MTNKHKILRNRVFNFTYKDKINQSTFDLVDALNTDVLKIIKNNLLKRPTTTINFLKTIKLDLNWCQDFLRNELSIPIQKKLSEKAKLNDIEEHNFEIGSELYSRLGDIIIEINTSINGVLNQPINKTVKLHPEINTQIDSEIGLNDIWKNFVLTGGNLTYRQIALLCRYEGLYPDMSKENTANKIAEFHGRIVKTSGQQLNQHYEKIRKSTDRIFVADQQAMKEDIKKILPLISNDFKNLALKDLSDLEKEINKG